MAEVSDETRLTVVKLLAGGRDAEFVAAVTPGLSPAKVVEIARPYGYPRPESMANAAEVLQRNLDRKRAGAPQISRVPPRRTEVPVPGGWEPPARPSTSARPVGSKQLLAVPTKAVPAPSSPAAQPAVPAGQQIDASIVSVAMIDAHPSNAGRDLGDLRDLAASIADRGVLVPVVLERRGGRYRLRDGHRRWAAAKIAKVSRIPAIIHAEQLDEADWLLESLEYNQRRKGYTDEDLRRVVTRLIALGISRGAIVTSVGMSWAAIARLIEGPKPPPVKVYRPPRVVSRKHLDELIAYCEEAGYSTGPAGDLLAMLAALVDGKPWRPTEEVAS